MIGKWTRMGFAAVGLLLAASGACSALPPVAQQWEIIDDPAALGYSVAALEAVGGYTEGIPTDAFVVMVDGQTLMEYGDTHVLSYVASVRKSVLAMLYGNYVADGTIDLDLTLEDMGMDDVGGLLPIEKRATVQDLITARSGVYHMASNPGDNLAAAPPRGSQEPGTYFLYSNWDFNAAGAVFEQLTGRNIYDALESDLALPLGFEDWERGRHQKTGDTSRSVNLAYHMHLSTSDLARLGEFMRREGEWNGVQVIPAEWARRIVSVVTPNEEMNPQYLRQSEWGYGYMWWVWDGPLVECEFEGAYSARGAYGQYITVIPVLDMVVAHKTIPQDNTSWIQYKRMLDRLVEARTTPAC